METIKYVDFNNNVYTIAGGKLHYAPMKVENSSSGIYSGGDEQLITLSEEQLAMIGEKAQAIADTLSLHLEQRQMLTAVLFVGEGEDRKKFIVARSELQGGLEKLLKDLMAQ
ncbi:MAG: hypothetical protein R2824_09625 [Saprospiraceae bacterium]